MVSVYFSVFGLFDLRNRPCCALKLSGKTASIHLDRGSIRDNCETAIEVRRSAEFGRPNACVTQPRPYDNGLVDYSDMSYSTRGGRTIVLSLSRPFINHIARSRAFFVCVHVRWCAAGVTRGLT